MPKHDAYRIDLEFRDGFNDDVASDEELALIGSILPQLMAELAAMANQEEGERNGSSTLCKGIHASAG